MSWRGEQEPGAPELASSDITQQRSWPWETGFPGLGPLQGQVHAAPTPPAGFNRRPPHPGGAEAACTSPA